METDYQVRYEKLQELFVSTREDLNIVKAQLNGDAVLVGARRESKIARQRKALHKLNRRVRTQRLQLRRLNELERGLRPEEWQALKAEFQHELEDPEEWEEYK